MANDKPETQDITASWDTYWQGAADSGAYTSGETGHPRLVEFWTNLFTGYRDRGGELKIIDIASGNGAVVDAASTVFGSELPDFTCVDVSESAIRMLEERFPWVHGVVADARNIPSDSFQYDLVTSQFGLEYAGLSAMSEVMRLVAPQGEVALLMHHRDGNIYKQCHANLRAIEDLQAAAFISNSMAMFEGAFEAAETGDQTRYRAAGKQFAPSIRAVEKIMMEHGRDIANGTVMGLYRDVRTIHERLRHHDPADVAEWLTKMEREVDAYAGRMRSMCAAAVDAESFAGLCSLLTGNGFELRHSEALLDGGSDLPLAWVLTARKQ